MRILDWVPSPSAAAEKHVGHVCFWPRARDKVPRLLAIEEEIKKNGCPGRTRGDLHSFILTKHKMDKTAVWSCSRNKGKVTRISQNTEVHFFFQGQKHKEQNIIESKDSTVITDQ